MAIAAQLEESRKPGRKSREPRRTLRLEARGALASGDAADVLVHNVSATGLLLECKVALASGARIGIDLPHAGETPAEVVWTSGELVGCRFDTPISAAALSAVQLRSAVERRLDLAPRPEALSVESFGDRLKRLRKQRGLTLLQIANRLDVTKPTVWAWEHGRARPVHSRIEALADALGVSSVELLPGRDTPELHQLIADSRDRIAEAVGARPEKVRILIEL